jgi:hypothetical protein
MKLHMSSHKVFQCRYKNCPKFYNAKRNLTVHIKSKHQGKRWICDLCGEEKSTKQKLEQHLHAHLDPEKRKLLNKKQTYKTSVAYHLIGLKLPPNIQEMLLNDEASSVNIDSIVPMPEPLETETSTAEMSDF